MATTSETDADFLAVVPVTSMIPEGTDDALLAPFKASTTESEASVVNAATLIGAHIRGSSTRKQIRKEHRAATTIQKSARGRLQRRDYQNLRKQRTNGGGWERASVPADLGPALTATTVLEVPLTQAERVRAARIVANMRLAEYTADNIRAVCRALFLTQSDEDLGDAWTSLLGEADSLGVDRASFRALLALLGEGALTAPKVDELFALVDTDGSGTVERPEFDEMMRALNPKSKHARQGALFAFFSANTGGLAPPSVGAVEAVYDDASPASSAQAPLSPQRAAAPAESVALRTVDVRVEESLRSSDSDGPLSEVEMAVPMPPANPRAGAAAAHAQDPVGTKKGAKQQQGEGDACCLLS